ncbi:hypothetical protein GCM10025778_28470 [Paeniglutamicibacter antarcticus]|uniref:HTH tetR-type domain-containing protein n=1 Tax=Paeniglutamicibacter antarcticus TaxID=494023 RepID=A0ABP9TNJ3_9MICC
MAISIPPSGIPAAPAMDNEAPRKSVASRRPRAHGLGREVIFAACLELAAATGPEGLSFGKIGRQPGADLTAVYRNFADPDELLLALADRVMAMGREGCLPDPWWR